MHLAVLRDDLARVERSATSRPRPTDLTQEKNRMRVVAGAGSVGRSIARELLANGHQVRLIDKDADDVQAQPRGVLAARRRVRELAALEEARPESSDVCVAATGDDKANLVLSLLAKTEFGVPRTVARVNNPKNEWMFDESWGVDVAVSTPRLMTALIEEAVSIGDLVRIFEFQQDALDGRDHAARGQPFRRAARRRRRPAQRHRPRGDHPRGAPARTDPRRRDGGGRRAALHHHDGAGGPACRISSRRAASTIARPRTTRSDRRDPVTDQVAAAMGQAVRSGGAVQAAVVGSIGV